MATNEVHLDDVREIEAQKNDGIANLSDNDIESNNIKKDPNNSDASIKNEFSNIPLHSSSARTKIDILIQELSQTQTHKLHDAFNLLIKSIETQSADHKVLMAEHKQLSDSHIDSLREIKILKNEVTIMAYNFHGVDNAGTENDQDEKVRRNIDFNVSHGPSAAYGTARGHPKLMAKLVRDRAEFEQSFSENDPDYLVSENLHNIKDSANNQNDISDNTLNTKDFINDSVVQENLNENQEISNDKNDSFEFSTDTDRKKLDIDEIDTTSQTNELCGDTIQNFDCDEKEILRKDPCEQKNKFDSTQKNIPEPDGKENKENIPEPDSKKTTDDLKAPLQLSLNQQRRESKIDRASSIHFSKHKFKLSQTLSHRLDCLEDCQDEFLDTIDSMKKSSESNELILSHLYQKMSDEINLRCKDSDKNLGRALIRLNELENILSGFKEQEKEIRMEFSAQNLSIIDEDKHDEKDVCDENEDEHDEKDVCDENSIKTSESQIDRSTQLEKSLPRSSGVKRPRQRSGTLLHYLSDQQQTHTETVVSLKTCMDEMQKSLSNFVTQNTFDEYYSKLDTEKMSTDDFKVNQSLINNIQEDMNACVKRICLVEDVMQKVNVALQNKSNEIPKLNIEPELGSMDSMIPALTELHEKIDKHIAESHSLKVTDDNNIDNKIESVLVKYQLEFNSAIKTIYEDVEDLKIFITNLEGELRCNDKDIVAVDDPDIDSKIQSAMDEFKINMKNEIEKQIKNIDLMGSEIRELYHKLSELPDQNQIAEMLLEIEKTMSSRIDDSDTLEQMISKLKSDLKQKMTKNQVTKVVNDLIDETKTNIKNSGTDELMLGKVQYRCLGCDQLCENGLHRNVSTRINHDMLPHASNPMSRSYMYATRSENSFMSTYLRRKVRGLRPYHLTRTLGKRNNASTGRIRQTYGSNTLSSRSNTRSPRPSKSSR